MANEVLTFLQYDVISKVLLPFLLVFFIVFAILEKTKLLGDKKQIHALIAFVIGLIFTGAIYPVLVVSNLILFLTVTIVAVFVVMLIWGFIFADEKGFKPAGWMKWALVILASIAFIVGLIWATGLWDKMKTFFSGGIGGTVITNAVFLVVIAVALALVIGKAKKD